MRATVLSLCLGLGLAACGGSPAYDTRPVGRAPATPRAEDTALVTRAFDQAWAARRTPGQAAVAADHARAWVTHAPADLQAYLGLVRAMAFVGRDPSADRTVLAEAARVAERGLRVASPAFEQARRDGAAVDVALAHVEGPALELAYWHAWALGQWAARGGLGDRMTNMPRARAVMEQLGTRAPGLDHGGAARWLAAYFARAPGIAGGSATRAAEACAQAVAIDPRWLENHLVCAVEVARPAGDRARYRALLTAIVATPLVADAEPEQHLAFAQATRLLALEGAPP